MRRKVICCVICALMITTILVIELPKDVSAQVIEEWVARYDGPGNDLDWGRAIAIDLSGNVYMTGESWGNGTLWDYATIKYDPNGNQLWLARYNGPGNLQDDASAITVETTGNVYVTGYSYGSGSDNDYATIKYDSNGNQLWLARYNGPGNYQDYASGITIDTLSNVYVTGRSDGNGTGKDYATIAYDSFGNELWVARYNGPGNYNDRAYAIATDTFGNIYVTGGSWNGWPNEGGTGEDYVTIAYDSSGNELWVARYNGPGNYNDRAYAISVDLLGNIYVTGYSRGSGTYDDYATVAYDSSGNQLWVARYNGPGDYQDNALDITVGASGNIYVTGKSYGSGTYFDYATVAYDSSGNQLWVARYNGPVNGHDDASAITTDSSGNIYVTGYSHGSGTGQDYITIAYDSMGNKLWIVRYNGLENSNDKAEDIAVDSSGNVYVTGWSIGNGTYWDYATIKYSQEKPIPQPTIDIDPNALNLKSKGRWITCYITLNSPYDVKDIDISTILLEDTIPAEWGDVQGDTLMVKFDRSEVEDMLSPGTYNLKVTGELIDGTTFEGYSDEIRVIDPGK